MLDTFKVNSVFGIWSLDWTDPGILSGYVESWHCMRTGKDRTRRPDEKI